MNGIVKRLPVKGAGGSIDLIEIDGIFYPGIACQTLNSEIELTSTNELGTYFPWAERGG
jgi:hypothetical protein